MKWFCCHWSDNRSRLGVPVPAQRGKVFTAPFVYLTATGLKEARGKVDAFNAAWLKTTPHEEGLNPAHLPTEELRAAGFEVTF